MMKRELPPAQIDVIATRSNEMAGWLTTSEFDCLILFSPEDVYLVTGFSTPGHYVPQATIIHKSGRVRLVCREFERPNAVIANLLDVVTYRREVGFAQTLADAVEDLSASKVGVQSDSFFVTTAHLNRFRALCAERSIGTDLISNPLASSRLIKMPYELDCTRRAGKIADAAMSRATSLICEGVDDRSLASAIYETMISEGGEYPSLPPFVAIGEGLPHATWSGQRAGKSGVVFIEIGASFRRYGAAVAKSVWVGERPREINAVYDATAQALCSGFAQLREGKTGAAVYRSCVEPLNRAGVQAFMPDRVGYSVGVSFPPDWGEGALFDLSAEENRVLREGMVFHLTPTVVIPEIGEIGCSVTAIVTASAPEVVAGEMI